MITRSDRDASTLRVSLNGSKVPEIESYTIKMTLATKPAIFVII